MTLGLQWTNKPRHAWKCIHPNRHHPPDMVLHRGELRGQHNQFLCLVEWVKQIQRFPCSHNEPLIPGSLSLSRCLLKCYLNDAYMVCWVKELSKYQGVDNVWTESFRRDRAFPRREIFSWQWSMERKSALFPFKMEDNTGVNGHISPEKFRMSGGWG